MIRIEILWQGRNKFNNLIRYLQKIPFVTIEATAANVAENTVQNMRETINSSRKRPDKGTHRLENAIDWAEVLNDPGKQLIIGIGEISRLTREAPYWEVINDGGYIPPANLGYFGAGEAPAPGSSGQNWTHTGDNKDFLMIPKSPIEGIDYIGKALRNLEKELNKEIRQLGGIILNGINRASK